MRAVALSVVVVASCGVESEVDVDLTSTEQAVVASSWEGDYETGDTSQWAIGTDGLDECADDLIGFVAYPARQGHLAARFEVNRYCLFDVDGTPNDLTDDDQKVELSSDPDQTNGYAGQDVYYGWSVYVPASSSVAMDGFGTTFAQWKLQHVTDNCGGLNANVALALVPVDGIEKLKFHVSGGDCVDDRDPVTDKIDTPTEIFDEPFVRGRWHDFVLHARWSASGDGVTELWWNGVKRHTFNNANMYGENGVINPVRVRQGIYRRFCSDPDEDDPPIPECHPDPYVIYHDAMRRGATYASAALPNYSFEKWVTSTDPTSWMSTGSSGFPATTFARYTRSSAQQWTGCSAMGNGSYTLRVRATHDTSSTAMARGVRQEDGTKSTRVVPGRSYSVRADICSIDPPASRGYRTRVFWFRADGTPSSTVSSTGPESGVNVRGRVLPWWNVVAPADAAYGRVQAEAVSATGGDSVDYAVDVVGLF